MEADNTNARLVWLQAAFDRVDRLHSPVAVTVTHLCDDHRRPGLHTLDCPKCIKLPTTQCRNITCCGWPCRAHLELHDETEQTCRHMDSIEEE